MAPLDCGKEDVPNDRAAVTQKDKAMKHTVLEDVN